MKRVLVVLTLMLAAARADAQQRPRSDSLPRELVIALLGGTAGMRQVDIQVGMADDSLPAELFRDALILGFADYRMSRSTVAYFPYAPQATLDTIRARLSAAGWKGAAQASTDSARGFVPNFGATMPDFICREGSVVHPSVSVRSLNRSLAVISNQRTSGQYTPCNPEMQRSPYERMTPAANTPLPRLPAPTGMQGRMLGMGGSLDSEQGLTMETGLGGSAPIADILGHYSSLFAAAGWQQVDKVLSTSIAVASFEITAKGIRYQCSLIVTTPTNDVAQARLVMRRK